MFETHPDFEHRVPRAIAMEGIRYWHAFALSSDFPWYLLRHKVRTDKVGLFITQTTAIAWESTLQSVLRHVGRDTAIDLSILTPIDSSGRWAVRQVAEVWLATPAEQLDNGPVLFRLRDATALLNVHLEPVSNPNLQRKLLIRFTLP